ncbi:MAG: MmcQ/YjbR family DNA-binding protein [Hamadaea sp.]|uniref:MmcQ/YjbR family DNA-binding protein n=1 Tax=Hamadaea sp. TaxID=2024425 RepID=UPI0018485E7E|nr:MmcQ/YjbR family DNA-binding protein [Hamadaea sp.]NUT19843.1 MmcQ/YjbR family DNA-binding protein [Hamadaea sp.]
MSAPGDVPEEILVRLRAVCLALPEAYEEPAWIGVRWRIRQRTVAHAYIRDPGDECVMTFRAPGEEIIALVQSGHVFERADWGDNVVRMTFTDDVDWAEVAELLTESYLIQAPKRLAALVDRPPLP